MAVQLSMASDGAIGLDEVLSLGLDEYETVCAEVERINVKRANNIKGK